MLTFLMVLDALFAVSLIAVILLQEPKASGMGSMGGSMEISTSIRPTDKESLLNRATIFLAVCFGVVTVIIAKMTM